MCITVMLRHSRSRCDRTHHTEGLFDSVSAELMQHLVEAANDADMRRQVIEKIGRYPGDKHLSGSDRSADDDNVDNHVVTDPG